MTFYLSQVPRGVTKLWKCNLYCYCFAFACLFRKLVTDTTNESSSNRRLHGQTDWLSEHLSLLIILSTLWIYSSVFTVSIMFHVTAADVQIKVNQTEDSGLEMFSCCWLVFPCSAKWIKLDSLERQSHVSGLCRQRFVNKKLGLRNY